ncbi:putative threonyl-tRNA synthetase, cytoplasmic [Xylaria bambusicola]|uniref:putative threonyl-tRNA synthetase, cytoplasmic n=1 Tax=Xylaria bambusicola TaxID=326684 RepID=UPI002007772B|nr:putative threonyl-tRNA synthetase, cytoplasmic [Xylaria bambusicola]KAI0528204.1 putative threonyl-tRNA synthetase, cytoplasmic [Xylaria bambusicola]
MSATTKKPKAKPAAGASVDLELRPAPSFLEHRLSLFDKLWAEQQQAFTQKPREQINITLPDGKVHVGTSWETTPFEIVRGISKSLAERTVVAKVNDELWDLTRPFEADSTLAFYDFTTEEGKKVFWHSSAHILGEAAERRFGAHLAVGPPTTNGFYYEMALPDNRAVSSTEDVDPLTSLATSIIGEKQPFQRLTVTKEQLLEMFKSNKYKQHIIGDKIPDGTSTTVYRCGPLIDLCRGPHVPDTGKIKAFGILKLSASYFLGDPANDSLQRVYGISFPDKKQLAEHLKFLEEVAKRDHRRIGKDQELFLFHDQSPGSAFFLPHGTIIYNTLQSFIRKEYWKRGYQEVHSPNMFNSALWKKSGHWEHYHEDMFTFEVEKDIWALKPMNCPGHCLIFASKTRSYKELPIRMAEFGVLHRNEASGALSGLTRVRRFVQDDSHIFCTEDQVGEEVLAVFDFLRSVYGKLDFTFKLKLSTRPEKFLGSIETWDKAEKTLSDALDKFYQGTASWELNPGDGAFYGPKVDITICDALGRDFQCATIQLDFQLPQRFDLSYQVADEAPASAAASTALVRPVIIHRAIYGSFERFIGILTEHFAGKWPFWLSPRQVMVIPVMVSANDYVTEVRALLRENEFHADVDLSANTLNKKIRQAQLLQYNFILVLGAKEMTDRTVTIRSRDSAEKAQSAEQVVLPLDEAIVKFKALRQSQDLQNKLE